ncbi:MAG: hypothetical protein IJU58_01630 [Clostridia bacterium]|nr:hypothetical protein [Clostridia bacterium]
MVKHTSTTNGVGAKIWFLMALSIVCIVALSLTIILLPKSLNENSDDSITNLSTQPMINADGWNNDILKDLQEASTRYGDNVALGTANGVHGVVVSLGGYKWQVVYRQNDIITLYCLDNVATQVYSANGALYANSDVCSYLNNQFYDELLSKIGYSQFADYIVPTGDVRISYQLDGMQNISLYTTSNQQITNNDIAAGQKVWLPSAYEIGGYLLGENASTARVNSFNTDSVDGQNISSGLWNLSSTYRQGNKIALRSNVNDQIVYVTNKGVLAAGAADESYVVRPAINIYVPSTNTANNNLSSSSKLAITGEGTQANPYIISTARDVITLSDNVLNGNTYAGKYIQLANDINLAGVTIWTPIGLYNNGVSPKPFCGTFDGNGHKVMHISSANTGLVGFFGYASGAVIKNLAVTSTNWATAGNYAGGIVSVVDNGTTISTSYNNSSVSGINYVGGIVGAVNLTGNTECSISDAYNTGAVAGLMHVGGIAGNANNLSISRVYSAAINSGIIDAASNATVTNAYFIGNIAQAFGTSCASWDIMKVQSTYIGFSFYSSSNPTGVWFKSSYLNSGFPTLKVFVQNVDVNLCTNLAAGGDYYVKIAGDDTEYKTKTAALGSSATFTAEANAGYRFVGWYTAVLATNGQPVINSSEAVLYNNAATFTQTLDDYLFLEARFMKTYTVNIDTLFGDFSTSYQNNNALTVSYVGTKNGNDYDIDSVITFVVNTNIDELSYKGIGYKTSSASSTYTSIGVDETNENGFWVNVIRGQGTLTYILSVGDVDAFITDVFDIQVQFERQFNLTLALETTGDNNLPTISVQFGLNGNTLTVSDGTSASAVFEYSVPGGLQLGVDMTNATVNGHEVRSLDGWTFEYGATTQNIDKTALAIVLSMYIPTNNAANDDIYELTLTAIFSLNEFAVTASSDFSGAVNTNDPRQAALSSLYLTNGSGASITSIPNDVLSMTAIYNTIVSVCFVPNFAYGYQLDRLVVDGLEVSTLVNSNNIYYYNFVMPTHDVVAVLYLKYVDITINNTAAVKQGNNYTAMSNGVSISPQTMSNVTYYNLIDSTTLTLDTTDNFNMCYALKSVDVSFDSGTTYTTILTYNDQVAQTSYTLYNAATLVKFLYQQSNTTLSLNNNTVTVRIVMQAVNISLTVVACYEGTSNVVESQYTSIALSTNNQISANTTTQVYSYILGTQVTITAGAQNYGYRVLGFSTQANASSGYLGTVGEGFCNEATYSFALETNTTIYAYYRLRTFNISFVSDANTLTSGNETLAQQGITAQDGQNNTAITLNFDSGSNTTSTISMVYGHTLVFSLTDQILVNSKYLKLVNISVVDVDTNAALTGYSVVTTPQTIQLIADQNGNVHANIRITLTYNFLQNVYLKLSSSLTENEIAILNGATLMFTNQENTDTTQYKLTSDALTAAQSTEGYPMVLLADGDGTTYTINIFFDISHSMHSTTVILSDSNNNAGTSFDITLSEGRAATITIESIVSTDSSVNISGYFVFG